jgi:hypothetical protein
VARIESRTDPDGNAVHVVTVKDVAATTNASDPDPNPAGGLGWR